MFYQRRFAFCLAIILGMLVGNTLLANPLKIQVQKDPYAIFYPAKTYGWHPLSAVYPKFNEHFRGAIERELAAIGFQKATTGNPDFWVGYQFYAVDNTKEVKSGSRGDYNWDEKTYRAGTLTIDLFSPDQRRLIFRVWADSIYDPSLSDEDKIKLLNDGVKKMAAKLPPPG